MPTLGGGRAQVRLCNTGPKHPSRLTITTQQSAAGNPEDARQTPLGWQFPRDPCMARQEAIATKWTGGYIIVTGLSFGLSALGVQG